MTADGISSSGDNNRDRRRHTRLTNSPSDATNANGRHHPFDQNHPRFRTCCSCHVRGCSLIIGVMEMIALIAAVVGTAVAYFALPAHLDTTSTTSNGQQPNPNANNSGLLGHAQLSLIGSVTALVIGSAVVALLFYGLVRERSAFLLPHLIAQLMAIIGLAAAVVVFVYAATAESEYGPVITVSNSRPYHQHNGRRGNESDYTELVYSAIVIGLCALAGALEIYFAIVVYRAYAYFYAKREAQEKTTPNLQLVSTTSFPSQDTIAAQRYLVQN